MIANKSSFEPHSTETLPNSSRVYVSGSLHPDIQVPLREIAQAATKSFTGELMPNDPLRVYDTSGPWGDPDFEGSVEEGLPPLRRDWVLGRKDVEEYQGRKTQPLDDGYLSEVHAQARNGSGKIQNPKFTKTPLRASKGHPVTQLWYARQGIITPEMEFIALRENMGRQEISDSKFQISNFSEDTARDNLHKQHAGSAQQSRPPFFYTTSVFSRFPQRIPQEITAAFVR
ncbi:MAG: hypothetical protein WEB60_13215, partial [Terrimicrobiaceae bacterium]